MSTKYTTLTLIYILLIQILNGSVNILFDYFDSLCSLPFLYQALSLSFYWFFFKPKRIKEKKVKFLRCTVIIEQWRCFWLWFKNFYRPVSFLHRKMMIISMYLVPLLIHTPDTCWHTKVSNAGGHTVFCKIIAILLCI